jgi:hypothetical protein
MLEKEYNQIDTDFSEISAVEFVCKIYLRGDLKCGCRIWISDPRLIGYCEDTSFRRGTGEVFNEMISLDIETDRLMLRVGIGDHGSLAKKTMTSQEISEYLWTRFSKKLES